MCSPPPGGGGLRAYAAPFGVLAFSQYAKQLAPCGGGRCYVLTAARWGRVARIRCAVWLLAFSQYAKQCAPPIPPKGGGDCTHANSKFCHPQCLEIDKICEA